MAKQVINNGTFDNDPSAEKIRTAFDKCNSNFTELYDEKVDKVTTSGVERVYTINADGSQGTKATSDFKDVLEFADFASFPATGESGKIYVALDTNLQYRWSGLAYVQIVGGTNIKQRKKSRWWANGGTTPTTLAQDLVFQNFPLTYTGTKQNPTTVVYGDSLITSVPRLVYRSAGTAGASCGFKTGNSSVYPFSTSTGYGLRILFDTSNLASVATSRISAGVTRNTADIGNVNPSSLLNSILVGNDTGDTNLWLMHNDGTGTCTRVDLGANFPHNNPNLFYEFVLFAIPNATEVKWELNLYKNSPIIENPLHTTSGKIITDLPTLGALCWFVHRDNDTTASAVEVGISYVENEIFY